MHTVCASFSYLDMNWHWTKENPPIHIMYSNLWEDNYRPHTYDICDNFISDVHLDIFKKNAPRLFENALSLVATMGNWYSI